MVRWRTNAKNKNYVFLWYSGNPLGFRTMSTGLIKHVLEECPVCKNLRITEIFDEPTDN